MSTFGNEVDVNVSKSHLADFYDALRGQLEILTGIVPNVDGNGNEILSWEEIRYPMLVLGRPGIGKTAGVSYIINELNKQLPPEKQLGYKSIRLGTTMVGTFQGIPTVNPTTGQSKLIYHGDLPNAGQYNNAMPSSAPDPTTAEGFLDIYGSKLPNYGGEVDKPYGVLFLDEITTTDPLQVQPALALCDGERGLGGYKLPDGWIVVAAGNGPESSNFIRLDDMTINRFIVFDIQYNFYTDFAEYARGRGFCEEIMSYLNFSPDSACRPVSIADDGNVGKQYASPRSWEKLFGQYKRYKMQGKDIFSDTIRHAGRIIGVDEARKLSAFLDYRQKLVFDVDKIFEGTEKNPKDMVDKDGNKYVLTKEMFHIILEKIVKRLLTYVEGIDMMELYNMPAPYLFNEATATPAQVKIRDAFIPMANALTWLVNLEGVEYVYNAFAAIRVTSPELGRVIGDGAFSSWCPAVDKFFTDNLALISKHADDLVGLV